MRYRNFTVLYFLTIIINEIHGKTRVYHHSSSSSSSEEAPPPAPSLPPATQQDKDDAAKIVNSQFAEKVIASILPHRTLDHRKVINNEIANLNEGKRFIEEKYLPNHKDNLPFKDLCFALVNDPITVLAMYLGEFLHRKDETSIIIPLTLCQQMKQLHYIYNQKHKNSLTKRRKKQRHPFANLMKVWIRRDRESDQICTFIQEDVDNDAENLKNEYLDWNDDRDKLENILIERCLKYGAAVVKKFETEINKSVEDAIKENIKNHDLVDAYTALALYVKDKYNYMATIMQQHCNGNDRWAVWILLVGFITGDDWSKIDAAFMKINNNVSLKDHILKNTESDKILLEMMAAVIDPKYKPTYL